MNLFRVPTPVRKVSKRRKARSGKPGKLGIVRLYGAAKTALRRQCYARDRERCVVCKKWLPFEGPLMERMHMAHLVGLGAGGSDVLSNVRTLCFHHHIEVEHNAGGKPVPRKAL